MKWDEIEEKWEQSKLAVREQWGELTSDDLETIAGNRETLARKLQQRYGIAAKQARQRVNYWLRSLDAPNGRVPRKLARGA